jgi:flagella basal body P-ring formation protein FlgA
MNQTKPSTDSSVYLFRIVVCLLVLFVLTLKPGYLSAASVSTIRTLELAEVKEDHIRLKEIAVIKGGDTAANTQLGDIVIGKAPLPGRSRRIDESYVRMRLRQNDIDLSEIDLVAPKPVEVVRSSIEIPKERIEKIVRDFVHHKISRKMNNSVRIKEVRVSDTVILPKGSLTYRVIPPKNMDFLGTVPMSILFKADGDFSKKAWAAVKFEVLTEAVVTKRALRRYQIITEADVFLQKVDLTTVQSNLITRVEDVLGKRTKRAINAHAVLTTDRIELPPLVNRGDVVLIIAESESLRVTALGEVRKRGCRGERIRVLNLDSKKTIYARVVDTDTVAVDF